MIAERIIEAARECMGTPFLHQGRRIHQGMDCAGLLVHVFQRLDLPYHDNHGYPALPSNNQICRILDAEPSLRRQFNRDLFPGAVLLMRIKKEPQHIAIYTGGTIVHSYSGVGRVVEHDLDVAWRRRIMRIYRIVE